MIPTINLVGLLSFTGEIRVQKSPRACLQNQRASNSASSSLAFRLDKSNPRNHSAPNLLDHVTYVGRAGRIGIDRLFQIFGFDSMADGESKDVDDLFCVMP